MVRPEVQALVRELASAQGQVWFEAQSRAADLIRLATTPFESPEALRKEFRYSLTEGDLDLRLTDEEIDELARPLVAIVDRPERTPPEGPIRNRPEYYTHGRAQPVSAAGTLHDSGRLWVLPHLSAALRRWRALDPQAAQSPAQSIVNIIGNAVPGRVLTADERRWIAEAVAELRATAASADPAGDDGLWEAADGGLPWVEQAVGEAANPDVPPA